jgi:dihydrofolate reductase
MFEAATQTPPLTIVVAVADNGVIGKDNALLWHLPDDLRYFKRVTLGKPVVMGRKTFQAIGKPLPGRRNLIVSRQSDLLIAGCEVVGSLEVATKLCAEAEELMIIGGAEIYAQALPLTQTVHLTRVHTVLSGDVFFPELSSADWSEVSREDHPADAQHAYPFTFLTLQRRSR